MVLRRALWLFLSSLCVTGYFEQFGQCVPCPSSSGASIGVVVGIALLLVAIGACLFRVRALLPVDVLKLGLSMLQVSTLPYLSISKTSPGVGRLIGAPLGPGRALFLNRTVIYGHASSRPYYFHNFAHASRTHTRNARTYYWHTHLDTQTDTEITRMVLSRSLMCDSVWGLSIAQILASGSTAYDIPWPASFNSFLSTLRLFLVDVISITRTNCAQPMNYYANMMTVFIGVKIMLALLLLGPWLWSKLARSGYVLPHNAGSPTHGCCTDCRS